MGVGSPVTVVQVLTVGRGGLIITVFMLVRGIMTMVARVVMRVGVHGPVRVPVFVPVRVFVRVVVDTPVSVFGRMIVRVTVRGAVGMAVAVRMLVPMVMPGTVPVGAGVIVGVSVHRSILVAMHVFVVMPVLVTMVMSVVVVVVVVVRMAVHGAVGMPMLVRTPAHRMPFHPGLALSATTYRTHARPPRIRFRRRHAGLRSPADDTPGRAAAPRRGRAHLSLHRITRTDGPGLALAHVTGQPGRPGASARASTSRSSTRISIPPVAWTW